MKTTKYFLRIGLIILSMFLMLMMNACDTRTPNNSGNSIYKLVLTANDTIIYADNGKTVATLSARLTNDQGEPISGVTVVFSATQGTMASNITTTSAGRANAVFDDDGIAGENIRITARYTDAQQVTVRDTVYIDVLPLEDLVGAFNTSTNPHIPSIRMTAIDSIYSCKILSTVRDDNGVAVENVRVNYRVLSGSEHGYLNVSVDSTNGAGVSQSVFSTDMGEFGQVIVEAYIETSNIITLMHNNPGVYTFNQLGKVSAIAFKDTVTINFLPPFTWTMNIFSNTNRIYADNGVSTAQISVRLSDENGEAVDTMKVFYSANLGTIQSGIFTNGSGIASSIFSDLGSQIDRDTIAIITARVEHPFYGSMTKQHSIIILAENPIIGNAPPDNIELTTNYSVIPDLESGSVEALISATVTDSNGFTVEQGHLVNFSATFGVISQQAMTNTIGVATANFTANDTSGYSLIRATIGGVTDSITVQVKAFSEAAYVQMLPSNPNTIVVAGGWGLQSTTIRAEIRDANGEIVTEPTLVTFVLGPVYPTGANITGGGASIVVTTNQGIAVATLNAGTQPGNVRVTASITVGGTTISSTAIPVTIAAGPPAYIYPDMDQSTIEPIGGGIYRMELGARVWDEFSNPVEDSTQVYWYLDPPNVGNIIGSSFTGNGNLNDDSYPGIAWTTIYWNSDNTFDNVHVISKVFDGDGNEIINVVNAEEDGLMLLPFYPGVLGIIPSATYYDFLAGNPFELTLTAILQDVYNNPIKNGRILFFADGVQSWSEADGYPLDPDGTGAPIVYTDNNGIAQIIGVFDQGLCEPVEDADGNIISYTPFTSMVFCRLLDPQGATSDQVSIQLVRTLP